MSFIDQKISDLKTQIKVSLNNSSSKLAILKNLLQASLAQGYNKILITTSFSGSIPKIFQAANSCGLYPIVIDGQKMPAEEILKTLEKVSIIFSNSSKVDFSASQKDLQPLLILKSTTNLSGLDFSEMDTLIYYDLDSFKISNLRCKTILNHNYRVGVYIAVFCFWLSER